MLWDPTLPPEPGFSDHLWERPDAYWSHLNTATQHLPAPVVAVYQPALLWNAAELVRRAGGLPIRVASKSVRVREVLESVLALPGFQGVLSYTLAEALWLSQSCPDIVVAYPSVDRHAIRSLITDEEAANRVTIMVDHLDQLDFIDAILPRQRRLNVRVCLDFDASFRLKGIAHMGVKRSPVHSAAQLVELARKISQRPGFTVVGVMSYEAQIAGVPNAPPHRPIYGAVVRAMQGMSAHELRARREAAILEVRQVAELDFVNAGGTGSFESTTRDSSVTEITAGSGLFGSVLFDQYRDFRPAPALGFACDVVRIPDSRTATLSGGGWVASGQSGRDRLPDPVWPAGLKLLPIEGAGEVQTPVRGHSVAQLSVGSRVWLRHAKAGEIMEHTESLVVVNERGIMREIPTYRGEQRCFL